VKALRIQNLFRLSTAGAQFLTAGTYKGRELNISLHFSHKKKSREKIFLVVNPFVRLAQPEIFAIFNLRDAV